MFIFVVLREHKNLSRSLNFFSGDAATCVNFAICSLPPNLCWNNITMTNYILRNNKAVDLDFDDRQFFSSIKKKADFRLLVQRKIVLCSFFRQRLIFHGNKFQKKTWHRKEKLWAESNDFWEDFEEELKNFFELLVRWKFLMILSRSSLMRWKLFLWWNEKSIMSKKLCWAKSSVKYKALMKKTFNWRKISDPK